MIKELDNRWRRRQRVYEDLSKMKDSVTVNHILSMKLNPNDEKHFCGVVGFLLSKYPKNKVLSQLRDMQRVIGKGLEEGKKKITLPYVDEYDDAISFAFLAYTQNENDAQILTDALCWSEKTWAEEKLLTIFGTLDYNDIITKLPDIIKVICNTRDCQKTEIPLQVCSILDIQ